ncbi:hypothetical protein KDW75_gp36 [Mycobacterium phage Mercurio]|uniref:Uncharacterized protein n=1 Tax=Mycobacterium phage Mercurio TaxID=2575612 RepID=A0A5J6T7K3_9CAUD|nr:hypothetical protein KDW75_gp36 [Mycobacterium phage Mercurio]QFG06038.1 hypothetical protein PBI_MERCURIO_36 [Mycobacterium phage Mercurio]
MSDNTIRPIWTPADYEETVADATKHRAIPGAYEAQAALYAEAAEHAGRHRAAEPAPEFGTTAHRLVLGADEGRPLPYRRNPATECLMCWSPAGAPCDPYCIARLDAADQLAHRDAVIESTIAEVERLRLPADDMSPDVPPWADGRHLLDEPFEAISCGRHRAASAPRSRWRAVLAVAAVFAVPTIGALWFAGHAKAETFDVCPSGLSGVATPDTSCAFADSVRAAFYWQPGWTVIATSPVTGKFYTMQCSRTYTDVFSWSNPKRCFGVNDAGAVLVVYVA